MVAAVKGVTKADPGDGRISTFTSLRIRPETLLRIRELAATRNQSQAMTVGELVEKGIEREEAAA